MRSGWIEHVKKSVSQENERRKEDNDPHHLLQVAYNFFNQSFFLEWGSHFMNQC